MATKQRVENSDKKPENSTEAQLKQLQVIFFSPTTDTCQPATETIFTVFPQPRHKKNH